MFPAGKTTLPAGNYGDLNLVGRSGITLVGDPLNPPVFTSFNFHDCNDIHLRGIRFQCSLPPDAPDYFTPNTITGTGGNFRFTDCQRIGGEANGVPTGRGLLIEAGITGVTFLRDTAKTWKNALINTGNGVRISHSNWFDTSGDTAQNSGTQGFLAEYSFFGRFRIPVGSDDHPDALQWQHNGAARPSKDITIRYCDFHSGPGSETVQTIFIKQEDLAKPGAPTFGQYITNVKIYQNRIFAGHTHGISLDGADGAAVYHNTLLRNPAVLAVPPFSEATYNPGIDVANSLGVTVWGNIAASAPPGNLIIQPADYPKYFTPDVSQPNCPLELIRALPGGPIYAGRWGAASVRP